MIVTVKTISKVSHATTILKLAIFCLTLLWATCVVAQTSAVRGKVTDATGKPISSASVTIKGTTTGTTTDESGAFSITASRGDVSVISYVGYVDNEITVGSENNITVALTSGSSKLDEVIVVGYGTQKRAT